MISEALSLVVEGLRPSVLLEKFPGFDSAEFTLAAPHIFTIGSTGLGCPLFVCGRRTFPSYLRSLSRLHCMQHVQQCVPPNLSVFPFIGSFSRSGANLTTVPLGRSISVLHSLLEDAGLMNELSSSIEDPQRYKHIDATALFALPIDPHILTGLLLGYPVLLHRAVTPSRLSMNDEQPMPGSFDGPRRGQPVDVTVLIVDELQIRLGPHPCYCKLDGARTASGSAWDRADRSVLPATEPNVSLSFTEQTSVGRAPQHDCPCDVFKSLPFAPPADIVPGVSTATVARWSPSPTDSAFILSLFPADEDANASSRTFGMATRGTLSDWQRANASSRTFGMATRGTLSDWQRVATRGTLSDWQRVVSPRASRTFGMATRGTLSDWQRVVSPRGWNETEEEEEDNAVHIRSESRSGPVLRVEKIVVSSGVRTRPGSLRRLMQFCVPEGCRSASSRATRRSSGRTKCPARASGSRNAKVKTLTVHCADDDGVKLANGPPCVAQCLLVSGLSSIAAGILRSGAVLCLPYNSVVVAWLQRIVPQVHWICADGQTKAPFFFQGANTEGARGEMNEPINPGQGISPSSLDAYSIALVGLISKYGLCVAASRNVLVFALPSYSVGACSPSVRVRAVLDPSPAEMPVANSCSQRCCGCAKLMPRGVYSIRLVRSEAIF